MNVRALATISFFGLLAASALGQVAYSDFNTSQPIWFTQIGSLSIDNGFSPGYEFQAGAGGQLATITVAIGDFQLGNGPDHSMEDFTLKLFNGLAGDIVIPTGPAIATADGKTSGPQYTAMTNKDLVTVTFAGGPQLVEGDYYWLQASVSGVNAPVLYWDENSLGVSGNETANGSSPQGSGPYGAFAVNVTPEPVTLGLGFTGLCIALRRRLKANARPAR